jgi:predicted GNAT family N-acyltransferase
MDRLEREAAAAGASLVTLHAQTPVEAFYHRLGYRTTSDEFEEAGIPHVEMEKPLGNPPDRGSDVTDGEPS